jgi:hypothetical protein
MEFNDFKSEILRRAKEANACTAEYRRACQSNDFCELMQVIKDNFDFAVSRKVIDAPLIEANKDQFNANQIYCNVDVEHGFLLASDNATVEASDNATVKAWDNATVKAWDNATVEAWDNATVKAYNNATVKAYNNATVEAWGNATVEAWGNATVEAYNNATVEASDNATVKAFDNSYVTSYYNIGCKLNDNAIYRIRESNTVKYASDNIRFEKVPACEPEETKKKEE